MAEYIILDEFLSEEAKESADAQGHLHKLVRCKDCKWWDKKNGSNIGYCHACKHGHITNHWEIGIYRTYNGEWFCAEGEAKGR